MAAPGEKARGRRDAGPGVPVFEKALPAEPAGALDEHLVPISELWAGFSEVAAANPYAWIQQAYTAEEIRTPSPDNRMIGFPYTKRMNSNNDVDQGAARDPLLGRAGRGAGRAPGPLGVPAQRHRRPRPLLRHRARRPRASPAMRLAGRGALDAGRRRRRRPRPRRPLLLLPVGGADRGHRARPRPRPAAHGHRRALLRRRAVEQLRDALHRHDGRACCARTPGRSAWSRPTAATSPSTPSASTAPTRRPTASARRAAGRGRRLPGRVLSRTTRATCGRVLHGHARARRRSPRPASSPACSPTGAGRWAHPGHRHAAGDDHRGADPRSSHGSP